MVEERLDIDTPEGVIFGYRVAGIGTRFIAALVDMFVLFVIMMAFSCAQSIFAGFVTHSALESWITALFVLFSFGLVWGYYVFFELVWNGQSPGKRWVGLRVIRIDGTSVTLIDALIRNLIRIIDFLPFFYAVGLVTMFFNTQTRRLGDLASGTLVVKEHHDVTLESVSEMPVFDPHVLPGLDEKDYLLIGDFLARRATLHNRDHLARHIGRAVAIKLGLPQPVSARQAEEMLLRLAHQSRRTPGHLD